MTKEHNCFQKNSKSTIREHISPVVLEFYTLFLIVHNQDQGTKLLHCKLPQPLQLRQQFKQCATWTCYHAMASLEAQEGGVKSPNLYVPSLL